MTYDPRYESWKEDQAGYKEKVRRDILTEYCLDTPKSHFAREMINIAVEARLIREYHERETKRIINDIL